MSEESKSILLQVRVDEQAAKKKLADLQKDLIAARKEEAELNKEIKKSGTVTDEQAAKLVALKGRLKELTTEQRLQTSTLEAQVKADKSKVGSIDQLKAHLKLLTDQWNSLSVEERENAEVGGVLQAATKATNDKLRELGDSVSDNRRNVGNYSKSILESVDGTGLLATITGKASQAQAAYTATLNITKASLAGNVKGLQLLKLALAATGIGAVVLLLGGLISFLTRTQEGLDKVSQYTKGFTTTIGFLLDNLSAAGKAVWDFVSGFESLGDAAKKLGQVLLDNLISRLKGFLLLWEGLKTGDMTKVQDAVTQIGTGITDATAKTKAFAKEMADVAKNAAAVEKEYQRIRDAERALTLERKKGNAEIEKQKMLAEDTTKSTQERAAAAKKAFDLEQQYSKRELELQRQRVANLEREQSLTSNLTADNDKLAEEKGKLYELEQVSTTKSIELQNKLNNLRREQTTKAAEARKAYAEAEYEALQRRLTDQKTAIELEILQTQEGSEARLKAVLALNEKERELALLAKGLTGNQVALLQAQFDNNELTARREHAQRLLDIAQKQVADYKTLKEKEYTEAQQLTEQYYAQERLKITQQLANNEVSQQAYQARLDQLQKLQLENQLTNAKEYGENSTALEQQIAEAKVAQRQREADEKARIAEAEYTTAVAVSTAMADLMTLFAGQSAAAAEFSKAVTLFQLGIATADALAKGIASSQSIPFPGNLLAMATTISAVTANIMQAKALLSGSAPTPPKFATGGVLAGPSHAQGGVQVYNKQGAHIAEVEGGETILTKNVARTPSLLAAASLINQLAGGKALTVGSFHQQGGILPGTTRSYLTGDAVTIDYQKIGESVGKHVPKYIKTTDIKGSLDKQTAKAKIINQ
jgi:hypothetical protein